MVGLAVGVSLPRDFEYGGEPYRFSKLPQAAADVERMSFRLQALAELADRPLAIEKLTGLAATHDTILNSIKGGLDRLAEAGLFVFVLEGHGAEVPDRSGDEILLGHQRDQIFPTADTPILDDELWELWQSRPDITLFTIADTCRAETITLQLMEDVRIYQQLGVVGSPRAALSPDESVIRLLVTPEGPNFIQFAASARQTDAGDLAIDGQLSGRFTQAILRTSLVEDNLASYETWFRAADSLVRGSDSNQLPVLYFRGPDPALIKKRPPFMGPTSGR